MKTLVLCLISFPVCLQATYSQNSMGVDNDLKRITSGNASSVAISTFTNTAVKGTRYLFDNWTAGSVTSLNGEAYAANYGFNFDKINQDIYAKDNTTGVSVLLDKSRIRNFKIGAFTFVSSNTLKSVPRDIFYQALAEDTAGVSLYKLTATKFVKANPNDIMNARTGNFTSEYVDAISYYVSMKNGELKKISLNENNIRKVLKEKSDKVGAYFTMNETREVDETFLGDLVRYVNQY